MSPSPGRGGGSAAPPLRGVKARKKPKEMEDGGGQRSPAVHPPAFWVLDWVAALASTWDPCSELLLARDGAAAGLGTAGVMGWAGIFPVECLRIRCFHASVVTTVSIRECVRVCMRVCVLGGGGWEGYFGGLMVAQCSVQLPVLPPTPSPTLRFRRRLPPQPGGGEAGGGDSPATQHHPPQVPHRRWGSSARQEGGTWWGRGTALMPSGKHCDLRAPRRAAPSSSLAHALSLMHVCERGP